MAMTAAAATFHTYGYHRHEGFGASWGLLPKLPRTLRAITPLPVVKPGPRFDPTVDGCGWLPPSLPVLFGEKFGIAVAVTVTVSGAAVTKAVLVGLWSTEGGGCDAAMDEGAEL